MEVVTNLYIIIVQVLTIILGLVLSLIGFSTVVHLVILVLKGIKKTFSVTKCIGKKSNFEQ